ncbi:hypothetical protein TPDSL_17890 [Terrisporobacter petrolearius]|uniref:helix-turn-helix domain-containing protein n=1 Tax=Terrisporobacter petrolearius TaxID=1460447 RepID=UPI003367D4D1
MSSRKVLTEQQLKAVEYLINGETVTNTAKLCKVSRGTIYNWMSREEFKAEVDRSRREIKTSIENKFIRDLDKMYDRFVNIAINSTSDKAAMDAFIYAYNSVCGSPVQRNINMNEEVKDKTDINWDELEQMMDDNKDNEEKVINLKNVN